MLHCSSIMTATGHSFNIKYTKFHLSFKSSYIFSYQINITNTMSSLFGLVEVIWCKIAPVKPYSTLKARRFYTICAGSRVHDFYISNAFFSIQSQCCLNSTWIELQMLLKCCLTHILPMLNFISMLHFWKITCIKKANNSQIAKVQSQSVA